MRTNWTHVFHDLGQIGPVLDPFSVELCFRLQKANDSIVTRLNEKRANNCALLYMDVGSRQHIRVASATSTVYETKTASFALSSRVCRWETRIKRRAHFVV